MWGSWIAAGASGYLLKNLRAAQLSAALRAARQGLPAMSPEMLIPLKSPATPAGALPKLTTRETDVLDLLWAGRSNAQIAEQLFLSGAAVAKHVSNIFMKLGLAPGEENRRVRAILAFLSDSGGVRQ